MSQSYKTIALWVVLIIGFLAFYRMFSKPPAPEGDWARVSEAAANGDLNFVEATPGGNAVAYFQDGSVQTIHRPAPRALAEIQREGGVVVYVEQRHSLWDAMISWLPLVFMFLFFVFFMRQMNKGTSSATDWDVKTFEVPAKTIDVTPAVNGLDDAKAALRKTLEGGSRIVLLTGPQGSGKSLLTQWLASTARRPLYVKSAAEFVHMFVGVGAARMRKFFEVASAAAPSIIVIEDIEAIAAKFQFREEVLKDKKHDEVMQTMLQLKDLLDGTKPLAANVVFIGTTSRVEILDETFIARFTRLELPKRG